MIISFYDLDYKIIDPMSVKCTRVHCALVSCPSYPGHVHGALGMFFNLIFKETTRVFAMLVCKYVYDCFRLCSLKNN